MSVPATHDNRAILYIKLYSFANVPFFIWLGCIKFHCFLFRKIIYSLSTGRISGCFCRFKHPWLMKSSEIDEVQRRGEEEPTQKPRMINQYNCYMNGVDKCDQMLSSYSIQRKTQKWWKKLFFRLVELSIINSMVLYTTLFPNTLPQRRRHHIYRTTLIHQLIQPLLDKRNTALIDPRQANLQKVRLRGKHFQSSRHQKRKCCTVWAYKRHAQGKQSRKKTSNFCVSKLFVKHVLNVKSNPKMWFLDIKLFQLGLYFFAHCGRFSTRF